ncbi:MAG: hypothetical protein AAFQ07_11520, partial [Chloroflexota bacterium]
MQIANSGFLSTQTAQQTSLNLRIRLLQVVLTFLIVSSLAFTIAISAAGDNLLLGTNIISPLVTIFSVGLFLLVSRGHFLEFISFTVTSYIVVV